MTNKEQEVDPSQVKELTNNPDYIRIVDKIDENVDYIDLKPFSHNIIGMLLREASEKFGDSVANDLIEEFGLERQGWSKVKMDNDI